MFKYAKILATGIRVVILVYILTNSDTETILFHHSVDERPTRSRQKYCSTKFIMDINSD